MTSGAHMVDIEALYDGPGRATYGEGVILAQHGLQCAAVAEAEGADDDLVLAALLHDVGHLVAGADDDLGLLGHDAVGAEFLARRHGARVGDLVGLHVRAKRYLCTVDPDYYGHLSVASVYTLARQGGLMAREEIQAFEAEPRHGDALRLRRRDDIGKVPGRKTPSFVDYRCLIERSRVD